MKVKAEAKSVRISWRKLKPIADLIRGKDVKEAIAILKFTPRKGARIYLKVLNSAVANAENNNNMNADNLYISEIYANPGAVMKRFKAGSMGRANPMLRRTSHVGVKVSERQ
jgi:large subunit ribosomal protein L22